MTNSKVIADGANELHGTMDETTKLKIDCRASMLFCNLKLIGVVDDWPETIAGLNDHQIGCVRHLAIQETINGTIAGV